LIVQMQTNWSKDQAMAAKLYNTLGCLRNATDKEIGKAKLRLF